MIDVPLYDSQVAWLANQNMNYLVGGTVPAEWARRIPTWFLTRHFQRSDGNLMLAVGNDRQFATALTCLGRVSLARMTSLRQRARIQNRDELVDKLQQLPAAAHHSHWLDVFAVAVFQPARSMI